MVPAVAVLIVAGAHVPGIPSTEVAGRAGATDPWHSGPIAAKVVVVGALTVTERVAVVAHWPAVGVKV